MPRLASVILLLWMSPLALSWTATYQIQYLTQFFNTATFYICATSTASPLSTFVNTTTSALDATATVPVTITYSVFDTAVASPSGDFLPRQGCTPQSSFDASATLSTTLDTYWFGPATISNPASCTQTKFTYTTAEPVTVPSILQAQATASSNAALATILTNFVSTNLGGQSVFTTYSAIFLKSDAFVGSGGVSTNRVEAAYLSQCVDPRRYACSTKIIIPTNTQELASVAASGLGQGTCATGAGTYPPIGGNNGAAATATATNGGTTAAPGSSAGTSSSPKQTGAAGTIDFKQKLVALVPVAGLLAAL